MLGCVKRCAQRWKQLARRHRPPPLLHPLLTSPPSTHTALQTSTTWISLVKCVAIYACMLSFRKGGGGGRAFALPWKLLSVSDKCHTYPYPPAYNPNRYTDVYKCGKDIHKLNSSFPFSVVNGVPQRVVPA